MSDKTALIIDDEPDVTAYHGAVLSDHGWQVVTANNPNEGLELARQNPPDVVLLDVMMPERGGLSTLIALRKDDRTKDVPVILVTGVQATLTPETSYEAFLDRFKHYHPDGYVEKPIDPDDLLRLVEGVVSARA